MSDVTQRMRRELEALNVRSRDALQNTAKRLLEQGIVRVHYGVDYVNDDGDAADYAVLEYKDGRIEELNQWLEALDYEVFLWGVTYCRPYTFDAHTAQVSFDESGGLIDTEENVIRVYHSEARRSQLETEYQDFTGSLEAFCINNCEELFSCAEPLKERGIMRVYFGLDEIPDGCAVSAWGFIEFEDGSQEAVPHFPTELEPIRAVIEELPFIGAFFFNVDIGFIEEDDQGGLFEAAANTALAYHTAEQLKILEQS
jgi:hypothetical protein